MFKSIRVSTLKRSIWRLLPNLFLIPFFSVGSCRHGSLPLSLFLPFFLKRKREETRERGRTSMELEGRSHARQEINYVWPNLQLRLFSFPFSLFFFVKEKEEKGRKGGRESMSRLLSLLSSIFFSKKRRGKKKQRLMTRPPRDLSHFFSFLCTKRKGKEEVERILLVTKKSGNRERCRKLFLWNRSVDDISQIPYSISLFLFLIRRIIIKYLIYNCILLIKKEESRLVDTKG